MSLTEVRSPRQGHNTIAIQVPRQGVPSSPSLSSENDTDSFKEDENSKIPTRIS